MDIVIRKALPDDAYNYASCHISCWVSAYKGIVTDEFLSNMPGELEQRGERYRQAFADPGSGEYYCLLDAERMIGFFFFNKSGDEDKPHAGEVIAIYLLEEYWGKGYGRKMMDYAVECLKHSGHSEVILWTFEQNNRARRFYERYGFTFDGNKKEMTNWGSPLILVRYVLKAGFVFDGS
jgi:GNAT superfamily N-acetyltransferase